MQSPGNPPGDRPQEALLCDGALVGYIDILTGNLFLSMADPVATRGYPLTCNVSVNSQVVEANRPMGNATFTYDAHVTQQPVYNAMGVSASHWMLVDGDGTRLDFGPVSAAPAATAGIFSRLTVTQTGYQVVNAGPLESLATRGNFTYQFNSRGQLTQIVDPAGNVQHLNYDANNRLISVVDVNTGKQITFQYNSALISQIIENGGGATTSLRYLSSRLASVAVSNVASGLARRMDYTYNADGTPSGVTRDGAANSALNLTYTPYPGTDGVSAIPLANENDAIHSTHTAWGMTPGAGAVERVSTTNAKGGTTYYDFDTHGNLLRTTLPTLAGATLPQTLTATYNGNQQVTSANDGTTHSAMTYDANGMPSTFTNGLNQAWSSLFNGADPVSAQDPVQALLGVQDTIVYGDPLLPHVPTGYTDANGNTWSFAHNAYGQTTRVTPPPGSPTQPSSVLYNETPLSPTLGYPLQATDGNGNKVTFDAYDALGDLLQASYYATTYNAVTRQNELTPFSTTFAYDAAQRPTRVTHPDGTTSQNVYVGRFLDHTLDEAGTQVNYSYCSICDALLGMKGPLGWALNWTLDGDHQIKTFKDANGHSTSYAYGAAGELTGETLPDGTTTSVLYNNAGLVRQITNGRGSRIASVYDAGERLQQVTFPTNGQAPFTYTYNIDDTIHSVTDGIGVTTFDYYPNGWVQSVVYDYTAKGLSALQELDYTYNPDGSRSTLTWKSGAAVVGTWNYSYDAGGRLTSLLNGWSENTTWQYDEAGNLTNQRANLGTKLATVNLAIAYNLQRGWPRVLYYSSTMFSATPGGPGFVTVPRATFSLHYDNDANTVGNLTGVTEGIATIDLGLGSGWNTSAVAYGYDALYRLLSDSRTTIAGTSSRTYGYDLAGNVQTINGSNFATYDAGNKISSLIGGSITHDGDGNVTSVSSPTVPAGTFTWDDRGLLTSASNGAQSVTYGYNAGGLRVRSQAGTNAPTFYVYDGSTLLGEVQATSASVSTPTMAYTWGANGLISERLLSTNQSLWYVFGPQGETRMLLNRAGTIVDAYTYSPYGVAGGRIGTDPNPFRYGGQAGYYTDTNNPTGTILCGLRWYAPALGRWLSRDPIGYEGGPNLYEYCGSNPIMGLDPFGESVTITFDRRSGTLTAVDDQTGKTLKLTGVFSGSGAARNDPNQDDQANVGPLPAGTYLMEVESLFPTDGDPLDYQQYRLLIKYKGKWHYDSVPRKTTSGKIVSRGGANLHPGTVSLGCVTVPSDFQRGDFSTRGGHRYPYSSAFERLRQFINNSVKKKPLKVTNSRGKVQTFAGYLTVK